MPGRHTQGLHTGWPMVALSVGVVVLLGVAQHVSDRYGGWVFVRTAWQAGAWWQPGTAQWVHLGWPHAALNAASMVLLLWAMRGLVAGALQGAALLGGYAGVAAVLALDPACAWYAGASGALHGFWAGNALVLLLYPCKTPQGPHGLRWLGGLMLIALLAKLWLQQRGLAGPHPWPGLEPLRDCWDDWGLATYSPFPMDFPVYGPAHAAGAVGGLGAVLLCGGWRLRRARAPAQRPASDEQ